MPEGVLPGGIVVAVAIVGFWLRALGEALIYVRGPRPELKAAYRAGRWGDGVAGGHPARRR